jgi:alkyl sulfatase BDS1-like metallo-beta-lactamase superfamily hydrolase
VRWAAELASWLVHPPEVTDADRQRLADIVRAIGQRSPAANIRNWCLVFARDLEGTAPIERHRMHRLRRSDVERDPVQQAMTLRVMLDPDRAEGLNHHVRVELIDGPTFGLHVRNCVSVLTDGSNTHSAVSLSTGSWAALLSGASSWTELVTSAEVDVSGDRATVARLFDCYDFAHR